MRNRLPYLLFIAALASPSGWADANKCYSIKDVDMKNDCLAVTKNDKNKCYSIKDKDMKNSCLARIGGQKSKC